MRTSDPATTAACLRDGGVVLMPTDTLPGLHASIDAAEAVARIQTAKGRDAGKPLLILAASLEAAMAWTGPLAERVATYAERCWPGPVTLILPASEDVPRTVTGGLSTIAVRVPSSDALRDMLASLPAPVVSTSANAAGEPPATSLDEAAVGFADVVDLVADPGWRGDGEPSTLVDATAWPPTVVRPGGRPAPEYGGTGN